jgi:hypothetical protein
MGGVDSFFRISSRKYAEPLESPENHDPSNLRAKSERKRARERRGWNRK